MIVSDHDALSVRRQSEILSLSRSGLYYQEHGKKLDTPVLANEILEIWQSCPFYGYRRITAELRRRGYAVNGKRVIRLMRAMNIEAIYPKPKLSQANKAHQKYGYLLRDIAIHAGQVWCTDITYIKLGKGFVYLVALIDVYSRYIVAWRLSVTLDTHFCLEMGFVA
jgi:putative transposase